MKENEQLFDSAYLLTDQTQTMKESEQLFDSTYRVTAQAQAMKVTEQSSASTFLLTDQTCTKVSEELFDSTPALRKTT